MIIIQIIILYFIQIAHTDDFPSTGTRLVGLVLALTFCCAVSPSDETPSLDRVSSVEESSEVTEEDQPIVEVEQVAAVTESWEDVKDSWEDEEENKETDAVDSAAANGEILAFFYLRVSIRFLQS